MKACCALGVFDGVHLGHRSIIASMLEDARSRGVASVIVSFDIDPDEYFHASDACRKLCSNSQRLELLGKLGADHLLLLPFNEALASLSPSSFLDSILSKDLDLRSIHVGDNFRFGRFAEGDVRFLEDWADKRSCRCRSHALLSFDGAPISASRIRDAVSRGALEEVRSMLGRDFSLRGSVVRGRGEGLKLGYPTANIQPEAAYVLPPDGVYAGYVLYKGSRFEALINIGPAPSFNRDEHCIEAHILDFNEDIYGCKLELGFCSYLRPQRRFANLDDLSATIHADIEGLRGQAI